MTNDNEPTDTNRMEPLAWHIRRLRRWYGERGLSQGQLADLAGISPRALRDYEVATELPHTILNLLRLAIAFRVPLEDLIAPDLLDELRADIEARRLDRGLEHRPIGFEGDGHAT